jgi:hypothetical protein
MSGVDAIAGPGAFKRSAPDEPTMLSMMRDAKRIFIVI